ncbi:flavin reductase family protein [Pseudooceanicola algae]|uniref:4-hydroxyphenylacetate 3-monooxygenase reductase component n=1 Tax=Pseudooceanicola algae TaxID=1537215 RepID=A0A418SIM7_9RHOB|nr:flavin reductase family protein [Pseudooceanicola algae]QPM91173.1 4-hydroxyphenylacetate 3-monooxygenase reductase component [Pseudooceanicola algae]
MTIPMTFPRSDAVDGLKMAMRHFASGVTVITAGKGDQRRGLTATAFSSVTMEPPTVLVCVNRSGATHEAITEAGHFCVNLLGEDAQDLAADFAGMTGRSGAAQFDGHDWVETLNGAPAYAHALAHIACSLDQALVAGSHSIFIGRVEEVSVNPDRPPLLHFNRGFHPLGERR